MSSHAHVFDPSWDLGPVPWAPSADTTVVPRLHAAVMDDCEWCLVELGEEAAAHIETAAVVFASALFVVKSIPPQLLPGFKGAADFEPPMLLMLERVMAAGDKLNSVELLAMLAEMDVEDRLAVFRGCAALLELHVQIMKGDEPGR